jgi:hypothetical protein
MPMVGKANWMVMVALLLVGTPAAAQTAPCAWQLR